MKKRQLYSLIFCFSLLLSSLIYGADPSAQKELNSLYEHYCHTRSDINEHIPLLRQLARECSSVIEIGLRDMVSSWGIFEGLAENPSDSRSYLGIDLAYPPSATLVLAQKLTYANGISFSFWKANDMDIDIEPAEMLFIDSLHTYCHLTYELEKFSPKISKYIAMHDTSEPWGDADDTEYRGDYSEYPPHFDRNKKGLWPAVDDFLKRHPEWTLQERRTNNHGFTTLKRLY